MSPTTVLLRWTALLIQPLVSPAVRARIDADITALDASDPDLIVLWAASLACDIAATLPVEDPWRAGQTDVADDLAPLVQDSAEDDPSTLPWAGGLSADERETVTTVCALRREEAADRMRALHLAQRLTVVRTVLARRQAYTGIGDTWVLIAANERLLDPHADDPTWLDPIGDGAYARITEPLHDEVDEKLRWLLGDRDSDD